LGRLGFSLVNEPAQRRSTVVVFTLEPRLGRQMIMAEQLGLRPLDQVEKVCGVSGAHAWCLAADG
jgi:hypothetical protein